VFYPGDVERISAAIVRRYFRSIEDRAIVPDSPKEFDYEGQHFVLFLPSDVLDDSWSREDYPTFFELQVKTLFQHSWAEANHDLAYKAPTDLTVHQRRMVAFTAAQSWGADQMFQELASELGAFEAIHH
jgi:putative GTP pyrophosphokinase